MMELSKQRGENGMKHLKKMIPLFLCVLLLLGMAACKGSENKEDPAGEGGKQGEPTMTITNTPAPTNTQKPTPTPTYEPAKLESGLIPAQYTELNRNFSGKIEHIEYQTYKRTDTGRKSHISNIWRQKAK